MPIDPTAKALVDAMEKVFPRLNEMRDGFEARERMAAAMAGMGGGAPAPKLALHDVRDEAIPVEDGTITVRVYRPDTNEGAPIVVFFHGGGWVLCDLESHDATARRIAKESGCVVVATDYRRPPEHLWPTAAEDCYAALQWAATNASRIAGDASRLAVFGDSAGGNLAAVVAQMARDRGGPALGLQILAYPVIDAACDAPSHREMGHELNLWSEEVMWCWQQYLPSAADGAHPYASPNRAASLAGLAPALVITPELDPLRDEGEAYAAALAAAGVSVTAIRYDGMVHSMLAFADALPRAAEAFGDIARALRSTFSLA